MGVMGAKKERRNFTTRSPSDVAAWATRSLNHSNWCFLCVSWYPLVNVYITMERSTICSWVNQLFLWLFSIAMLVYQRVNPNFLSQPPDFSGTARPESHRNSWPPCQSWTWVCPVKMSHPILGRASWKLTYLNLIQLSSSYLFAFLSRISFWCTVMRLYHLVPLRSIWKQRRLRQAALFVVQSSPLTSPWKITVNFYDQFLGHGGHLRNLNYQMLGKARPALHIDAVHRMAIFPAGSSPKVAGKGERIFS